jgi:hypothetical protein
MSRSQYRFERHLVAIGAVLLAVYNIVLAMLPAPLSGLGQIRHVVPIEAVRGSRFVLLMVCLLSWKRHPNSGAASASRGHGTERLPPPSLPTIPAR